MWLRGNASGARHTRRGPAGWRAQGLRAFGLWLRGEDLNLRPSGYEPDELPGCSTPRGFGGVCEGGGEGVGFGWPGGDLLSRVLRRSTIGAEGVDGRVRDGIGCLSLAMTTRPAKPGGRDGEAGGRLFVPSSVPRNPSSDRGRASSLGAWRRSLSLQAVGRSSAFERLVPVGCVRCRTSTPGLSTWWSSTALIETWF